MGKNDAPRLNTVTLDAAQSRLLALPADRHAVLLGAPGTGKTETLVQLILHRIREDGLDPAEVLLLTPDRRSATRLRDELVLRLGVPVPGAMARSVGSLAFEIVNQHRIRQGKDPVALLTGGEQDQLFAQLLDDPELNIPWPSFLNEDVRQLLGFRTELRDLWLRSVEYGLNPASDLAALAPPEDRGEWAAAQAFFGHYQRLLEENALGGTPSIDSAQLVSEAARLLRSDEVDSRDRVSALKLLVLDDAQETVESTRRLVQAFVERGVTIVAAGDPDLMTGRFRGALPEFLGQMSRFLTNGPELVEVTEVVLPHVYRFGPKIQAAVESLKQRIGTAQAGTHRRIINHRAEHSEDLPDEISIRLVDTFSTEVQLIAGYLRRKHFLGMAAPQGVAEPQGIDWNRMAVIVRSRSLIPSLMRELAALEVPVRFGGAQIPVRDQPIARDLLTAAAVALGIRELNEAVIHQLLLGPLGGFEPLELRRFRRMLLLNEFGEEHPQKIAARLIELFEQPESAEWLPQGQMLDRLVAFVKSIHAARQETNLEALLWGLWERSGLAERYLAQTRSGGLEAEIAHEALDAAVALFTLAARFVERNPRGRAQDFIEHLLTTDLPEDNLAPRFAGSAVTLLTPSAAVATEFDVVVVTQVQESVWPDTRLRDTLLGAQKVSERVRGGGDAPRLSVAQQRTEVIHDELRMFVQAISRSSTAVLITAVNDEENGASPFLNRLIDSVEDNPLRDVHPKILSEGNVETFSLRRLVARLRRELTQAEAGQAETGQESDGPSRELIESAQQHLAALRVLADHGVPGAHPDSWYGLQTISSTEPLVDLQDETAVVGVSPSQLENFIENELGWVLRQLGGDRPSNTRSIGNILHKLMEENDDHSFEALWEWVQREWKSLDFEAEWLDEKEFRRARVQTERLAHYLQTSEALSAAPVIREAGFKIPMGRAVLVGRIDRIEQHQDGSVHIVDLKTGKTAPSQPTVAENLQLRAYQYAVQQSAVEEEIQGTLAGAKLVYLSVAQSTKEPGVAKAIVQGVLTEEQAAGFVTLIKEAAIRMAGAEFVGKTDDSSLGHWSGSTTKIHVIGAVSD